MEGKILGQKRGLKNPWSGEEDVFLIHPHNSLNGLILDWGTGVGSLQPYARALMTEPQFVIMGLQYTLNMHTENSRW